jgi:uncharacterized protein (TIGR00369 family)
MIGTAPKPFSTPPVASHWEGVMETFFSGSHHLFAALRMKPTKVDAEGVSVIATIPEVFSVSAAGKLAHRGAYTIILDTVFGFAVFARLQMPKAIATINLKTDYLRPVEIGERIICSAECHALDEPVARVRGEIVDYDGKPLASATGAFMIGSSGPDFTGLGETPRS